MFQSLFVLALSINSTSKMAEKINTVKNFKEFDSGKKPINFVLKLADG